MPDSPVRAHPAKPRSDPTTGQQNQSRPYDDTHNRHGPLDPGASVPVCWLTLIAAVQLVHPAHLTTKLYSRTLRPGPAFVSASVHGRVELRSFGVIRRGRCQPAASVLAGTARLVRRRREDGRAASR